MAGRGRFGLGLAGMALLGATIGVLLDGIHTHVGATSYTHPAMWNMAWWAPLVYAAAFAMGLLRPLLERPLGNVTPPPSRPGMLVALAPFVAAYWLTVAPLPWPVIAAAPLALFAAAWARLDRTPVVLGIAVAAAVGGPAIESFLAARADRPPPRDRIRRARVAAVPGPQLGGAAVRDRQAPRRRLTTT